MAERSVVLLAYDKTLEHIRDKFGVAAAPWLARNLGVTRWAVDKWGISGGFPTRFVPQISELTGLPQKAIRPKPIVIEIMPDHWEIVCKYLPQKIINFFFIREGK